LCRGRPIKDGHQYGWPAGTIVTHQTISGLVNVLVVWSQTHHDALTSVVITDDGQDSFYGGDQASKQAHPRAGAAALLHGDSFSLATNCARVDPHNGARKFSAES